MFVYAFALTLPVYYRERSGSVVERLTRDRRAAGSSLTGHCVVSLSKNINPSLVLVQPRKTRPFITERLLMGRKNQIKQNLFTTGIFTALIRQNHMKLAKLDAKSTHHLSSIM